MSHRSPFVVAVDTREQMPYLFTGIPADVKDGGGLTQVAKVRKKLDTGSGDYTILGLEGIVAVERKSKEDLYQSISQGRDNFERRLVLMSAARMACVVVEAEYFDIISNPPSFTQYPPKSIARTIDAWVVRYPKIHWWFMPDRQWAELKTYRLLERCWKDFAQDYPNIATEVKE
jgi:hypothetical protein